MLRVGFGLADPRGIFQPQFWDSVAAPELGSTRTEQGARAGCRAPQNSLGMRLSLRSGAAGTEASLRDTIPRVGFEGSRKGPGMTLFPWHPEAAPGSAGNDLGTSLCQAVGRMLFPSSV